MWVAVTRASFQETAVIFQRTCSLTITFMCGPPWSDEQGGHADVGHHREHLDIVDGGSGLRDPSKLYSQLHKSAVRHRLRTRPGLNDAEGAALQLSSWADGRRRSARTFSGPLDLLARWAGWVTHRATFWSGYASTARVRCTALAL